ncbi:Alg9-like mannosyltransferase family-domain-containing protein [Lipomyces arxii]|uniref:Alg9-like mannosyltransferase family-domain-containing protein n=1 Tax=Lipomyces arxii TaxID=56418 RepID=UPI0034CE4118
MQGDLYLFSGLLAFRLVNALTTGTYFQPDEFWQGLEPAHELVFGYGYLTWEWRDALRSIAHPLVFAGVYRLSEVFGFGVDGVLYGPKVLQSLCAALADIFVYKFSSKTYGDEISRITLLCTVTSAFNYHVSVRTFSNSMEMALLISALYFWPLETKLNYKSYIKALVLAAIACILRPTNALIWLYMGISLIYKHKSLKPGFSALAVVGIIFSCNALLDIWYYRRVTWPLYNFLKFNVVESLSSFYGVNRKLYYIIEALPQLLTVYLPFFFHGIYSSRRTLLAQMCAFVVFTYSLIAHKEMRFIYPLLPLFHIFSAISIVKLRVFSIPKFKYALVGALLALNLPLAIYASIVHQRGVIDVTTYIRSSPEITSVGFLMPCHSTPWMSHIHRPDVNAWFLTCEPPTGLSDTEILNYRDEADQFYDDPVMYLSTHFPPLTEPRQNQSLDYKYSWPTHLIIFGAFEKIFTSFVNDSYIECKRIFNSHLHDDSRRKGDVIVYRKV